MGIYHEWNGTVLTISSDSGTSSADLKGEKGDTGIRGPQGIKGNTGEVDMALFDGYATENYVKQQIAEAQLPEKEVDLSYIYTKEETDELISSKTANVLKGSKSGLAVGITDISPIEHTLEVKATSKNLFDISKVIGRTASTGSVVNNGDGTLSVTSIGNYQGNKPNTLKDYAPNLEIGKTYILSMNTNGLQKILLSNEVTTGVGVFVWEVGKPITMTQNLLESTVFWYAQTNGVSETTATISNIQIEEGTTATTYSPYITDISGVVVNQFGANVMPYPYPQTTRTESGINWTDNGDGSITANGTASTTSFFLLGGSWGQGGADKIFEDGKTYRLCSNIEASGVIAAIQTTDRSTGKLVYITNSTPFTINKSQYDYDTIMLQVTTGTTVNNLLIYVCIEEVNTSEAIHTSFIPNEDGVIEGVNSYYSGLTLVSNTTGVKLDVKYNKDLNKAFEEVYNAIISLGGNI